MSDNQINSTKLEAWAAGLQETLPELLDACVDVLREAKPGQGEAPAAERSARAIGVVARSARAVLNIMPKGGRVRRPAEPEEDGMNQGDDTPEALERLRDELESRLTRLRSLLEHKSLRVEPGAWPSACPGGEPLRPS